MSLSVSGCVPGCEWVCPCVNNNLLVCGLFLIFMLMLVPIGDCGRTYTGWSVYTDHIRGTL